MNITITTPQGKEKIISIGKFSVLDGYDIQSKFFEFATTKDRLARLKYTLEVLSYAEVVMATDRTLKLATSAIISNHLCSPENVKLVFEAVLLHNGIDPTTHASDRVSMRTATLAESFVAKVASELGLSNRDQ